jgi:DNA-binding NarL/FixJ family response regulator
MCSRLVSAMLVWVAIRKWDHVMKQAWSLLIGQPGPLRDGLGYLLTSMLQKAEISTVDDIPSALCRSDEPYPHLVLLIADASSIRLDKALERLRLKWPLAKYVVLVDDEQSMQMAQSAGADKVLLKGCRAGKLVEAIEEVTNIS